MFQMIINILLVLSVLLNAYFALKLEHDQKELRMLSDKRQENINQMLSEVALNHDRLEKQTMAGFKEYDEKLSVLEKTIADLPIEQMDEEAQRLKTFNDGIDNIMNYGFEIPKLNREGLKNG